MPLQLYNSLTRDKQPFVPLNRLNVRMYVCGPTVYDFAHIGNARPVIVFDLLFRLLRHEYGEKHVTYVRNITDIDDKINERALRDGVPIRALAEKFASQYERDVRALHTLQPTFQPRATEYIEQIRSFIDELVRLGSAYVKNNHVLFDVSKSNKYGELSNRSLGEMLAGSRVEVADFKDDPMDFVLWKPSEEGQPAYTSPSGIKVGGRPGWHIECSAMGNALLGETFDIHGGGIDLIFPHHENEIAQSEAAHHGHPLASVWMHNGFLQIEGEKMSKSLGNFFTINDLLRTKKFGNRKWKGDVLKFAMLQTHYRQPIDFSLSSLELAEGRLLRWQEFSAERVVGKVDRAFFETILECVSDDLNTPDAFGHIDRYIKHSGSNERAPYTVYKILNFFGFKSARSEVANLSNELTSVIENLTEVSPEKWLTIAETVERRPLNIKGSPKNSTRFLGALSAILTFAARLPDGVLSAMEAHEAVRVKDALLEFSIRIHNAIEARNAARSAKDFTTSDRIRDELLSEGVVLKDGPLGTTWELRR